MAPNICEDNLTIADSGGRGPYLPAVSIAPAIGDRVDNHDAFDFIDADDPALTGDAGILVSDALGLAFPVAM